MLLLAFVSVFCLTVLFSLIFFRPRTVTKNVERTLELMRNNHAAPSSSDRRGVERSGWNGFAMRLGESVAHFHFADDLGLLILHAGSSATVGSVVAISLVLAAGGGIAAQLFVGSLPIDLVAILAAGGARWLVLKFQKSRRMRKFTMVLPDAIDLLSRALRAGHSISSAVEVVAEQSAEPLAAEFAIVFQQQKFGIPFRDAVLKLGDRVPSKDLQFLITAILVQRETGGDLTQILDRTARVIRDRIRIEGEIRTYTAQGRLTGWILGLMPVLMLGLINILSPGYSTVLFHDPLGRFLLYAGAILIGIGGLIIRKIVDIQV
jgi:tight adherence protein B